MNMAKIEVKGTSITVVSGGVDDYISHTSIACYKDSFTLMPKRWILDWPHGARLSPVGGAQGVQHRADECGGVCVSAI